MRIESLGKDILCAVEILSKFDVPVVISELGLDNFILDRGLCFSCRFNKEGEFKFATLINDNSYEESDDRSIAYITLDREDIKASTTLERVYNFVLGFTHRVINEGIEIKEPLPLKVKEIIDSYYEGTLEIPKAFLGAGRKVMLVDNYAIKFPAFTEVETDGLKQNEFEQHITEVIDNDEDLKDARPVINRVLYCYRSVNVYKRLNNNIDVLCERFGYEHRLDLEGYISREFGWRLACLENYEDLNSEDALRVANWGYDEDEECWKCLDYGLSYE